MTDEITLPAGAHEDVLRWLSRELDRDLPARERILLADHLDGCPRCARVAAQLRSTERTLRADAVARPPVALVDRILARIARADAPAAPADERAPLPLAAAERAPLLRMLRASAALAAALLVLVGSLYVAQGPAHAIAGTSPTLKSDPEMMRVLERWQKGHAAPPNFFELLLAPARPSAPKSR